VAGGEIFNDRIRQLSCLPFASVPCDLLQCT